MRILVVVDMQNDFIAGALENPDAEKIIPKAVAKIKEYAVDPEAKIYFTMDTHQANTYADTIEGKKLPVPHCIDGTPGWEIIPEITEIAELKTSTRYSVVVKPTFGSIDLGLRVKDSVTDECSIEVIGLCTDICVISNALLLKAFLPNIPITVDAACCAGVTPESHDNALNAMKMCHIDVINQGEEPWRK